MSKNLELFEFIRLSKMEDIIFEDIDRTDPWNDSSDAMRYSSRQDRADMKQVSNMEQSARDQLIAEAEPVKIALTQFIVKSLPFMKGVSDRMNLEELIVKIGHGNIRNVLSGQTKPGSFYQLASSVHNFMLREKKVAPKAVDAFLEIYGRNVTDWIEEFTPIINKVEYK